MSINRDSDAARTLTRVAITLGDPNGIGPEVVLKSLADVRNRIVDPVLIGSPHVLRLHAKKLKIELPELAVVTDTKESIPAHALRIIDPEPGKEPEVAMGEVTGPAGELAMRTVDLAVDLTLNGAVEAMVTAPISKRAIALAGYEFPGHTEFLVQRTGATSHTMMMVAGTLRVGLLTAHIRLTKVGEQVSKDNLKRSLKSIAHSLREDFGILRPQIAVLGLNPHAGEDGLLGDEERDVIIPSIKESGQEGVMAFGPFPADGFFGSGTYREYDAVLAMYHDQGLIPFKTLSFGEGVNYTAGLPIVRTSPDHGTAFGIVGRNQADRGSMRHAIYLAVDIVRQRKSCG